MLRNVLRYLIVVAFLVGIFSAAACADPDKFDPCSGENLDPASGFKGIAKVKPSSSQVLKVKPSTGWSEGYGAVSRLNPVNWWQDCCLPAPAPKQFVVGPSVFFPRLRGDARRPWGGIGAGQPSLVHFDEHLKLGKSSSVVWSIDALYQMQPRLGLRYSFTPIHIDGGGAADSAFNFMGHSFTSGTQVRSKWESYQHRAGLIFNVNRTPNSVTSVFADWLYIQDKLTVSGGAIASSTWDENKSLAVLGLEFNKCLKNFRGNTLAFTCKGGLAFLDDHFGYDAAASLNYIIPIKRGRFGFLSGGYRYAHLKKEKDNEVFSTTMDGAFVQMGFLF
jgi:hypothetical protein